ncbi:hypothetical protein [Amycolatopsis sp. DSM 110486]|uniref:hypothetical protein n=1 Tax=Amycolatopsis sp. DSM 110486 TaxID=2865832 RepID=UPI001C6984E0|nr:hypothetical protein [Amycolatopsis sp. DSM 110486]QYN17457.1 hypothetical protein K1T34_32235 [Amycolatopsis sp. DSM 110486]
MTIRIDTTSDETQLTAAIDKANLGPARVTMLSPGSDRETALVVLEPTSPAKAQTLLRWLDVIDLIDATSGKWKKRDPRVRLNLRGRFPSGMYLIVACEFDERTEAAQTDLISELIEPQQIVKLVRALADMEYRAK